ncbi:unnamed protein product [Urochloa humidicola]
MAVARLWQLSMAGHAVVVVFVALGIAAGVLSSGFIDSGNTRHGWSNKIKSSIHHRLDLHVLTLDSADSSPPASSLALLGQRSSRGAVIIDHHLHFHLSTAAVLQSTSHHRLRQHRHLRRPFYNKSATAEADEANLALLRDVAALGLGQRASIDESACDDCPFKAVPYVLWLGVSCCARGVAELQASAWPARRRSPLLLGPVRRWRQQFKSTWAPSHLPLHVGWLPFLQVTPKSKDLISGGCRRWTIKSCCYVDRVKQRSIFSNMRPEKMETGTSFKLFLFCTFGSNHGSGKAPLNIRADLRLQSMLVFRFNGESSRAKISLSPVKPIRHLRLKNSNPRRHRPIRQPRRAPVVLSECNKEDPRCFWRGHPFSLAQRLRQRHHLCLLHRKCSFQFVRSLCTHGFESFHLSLCFGSFVVAQKLHQLLGWKIPIPCTPPLSY